MKRTVPWLAVIGVLALPGSAPAIEVLDPDYASEEYVTISGPSWRMTFDDAGNLYLVERLVGEITRVTPAREVGVFTTIPPPPGGDVVGLTWTGGTAFGEDLYALWRRPGGAGSDVLRIDESGSWTTMAVIDDCGTYLGLDRTGLYGGNLYSGTGCRDRIFSVTPGGSVSVFSPWPFGSDGGGPRGIDFDPSGRYGGQMYVASDYSQSAAGVSGLFELDAAGNATRFAADVVAASMVLFAPGGPMFDQEMFVYGTNDPSRAKTVWRVAPDGVVEEFIRGIDDFSNLARYALAFGPDGAMYLARYSTATDTTTVHRIFGPLTPRQKAIVRIRRAIDEKTVAIEAIQMAMEEEREAFRALADTELTSQQLRRARALLRLAIARQRLVLVSLQFSQRVLDMTLDLLGQDSP